MRPTLRAAIRRGLRDAALSATSVALVAFTALLVTGSPVLVQRAVDAGAADAVTAAGRGTDIVVSAEVARPMGDTTVATIDDVLELAADLPDQLSPALHEVAGQPAVTVVSPGLAGEPVAGGTARTAVQVGMLTEAQLAGLQLEAGALPAASAEPSAAVGPSAAVDVVVSAAAAQAAGLQLGSLLRIDVAATEDGPADSDPADGGADQPATLSLRISGIVAPAATAATPAAGAAASDAPEWFDLPRMWNPATGGTGVPGTSVGIVALASPTGLADLAAVASVPLAATVRVPIDPAGFTADLQSRAAAEVRASSLRTTEVSGDFPVAVTVRTTFTEALADFPSRAAAAVAQMTLMLAGLLGVAATVIVLLARLLAQRRMVDLGLERDRGASAVAISGWAFAEAMVTAIGGTVVGAWLGSLLFGGARWPTASLVVVAVVAVGSAVAQTGQLNRRRNLLRRRRVSAADRRAAGRITRLRRLALEAVVLIVAGGAMIALRDRGLLMAVDGDGDPLLAAAPTLLAASVTVLLLRVFPVAVQGVSALARRARGPAGILAAAQAARALAVLPLAAVTLAVSLGVGGGMLVETVHSGLTAASWRSVGADARVRAPDVDSTLATVAGRPGVTAAGSMRVTPGAGLTIGPSRAFVTVLAVDPGYADVVAQLGDPDAEVQTLRGLATAAASEPLPVVVDATLAARLVTSDLVLDYEGTNVALRVVGTVSGGPDGYLRGPFVYLDLAGLSTVLGTASPADTVLLMGPGADAAAAEVEASAVQVITRSGWLDTQQHRPLVAGVLQMMVLVSAALGVLAALALIAGMLGGAPQRARSVAMLRTLGLRASQGWWLAFAETAPVVLAALVGGGVGGAAIAVVLGPSLGLGTLTGDATVTEPVLAPGVLLEVAAVGVLLLVLSTGVEVVFRRRTSLGNLMRLGGAE